MNFTEKSQSITFHNKYLYSDLFRYLSKEDVLILLNRLPLKEYEHLRSVTFETCAGADAFGYVRLKRIKSIVICDQGQRPSINTKIGKRGCKEEFGALNNMKWPTLAVRRYLLYNTFLHELRHTQFEKSDKKYIKKKIPLEKLANEYADYWRGELYKETFIHEDPVHNLPSALEKERLQRYWPEAMKHLQKGARHYGRKEYIKALEAYELSIDNMKLYFGDLGPINYDVEKLNETIQTLKQLSVLIVLSSKPNLALFKEAEKILIEEYGAQKIDHEGKYQSLFQFIHFEIEGNRISLGISPSGVYISPRTMNNSHPLTAENKLVISLKNRFKK